MYKNIVGRERQASQKKLNVKNRKGKFHVKNVIAEDIKTDFRNFFWSLSFFLCGSFPHETESKTTKKVMKKIVKTAPTAPAVK